MMQTKRRDIIYTLRRGGSYRRVVAESVIVIKFYPRTHYKVTTLPKKVVDSISNGWQLLRYKGTDMPGQQVVKGGGNKSPKKNREAKQGSRGPRKGDSLSPVTHQPTEEVPVNAQGVADILNKLLTGTGSKTTTASKYNVDVLGLLLSYDKGENPLDYLSKPVDKERKPKIVISPDYSASCNANADFFSSVANVLAANPAIEVYIADNSNGNIVERHELEHIANMNPDILLYIGDNDVFETHWKPEANILNISSKLTIVTSNVCCNYGDPQVSNLRSEKNLVVLEQVSYSDRGEDIENALGLLL